ncbi:MAG: hypothetical protein A2Z14_04870 [Chloroflexi bacterium RBG_16_48_8]|nr:MAG: hypothetical protein A2Z14_04870 [Chloroflexi bacterium RBG_16_48_8]
MGSPLKELAFKWQVYILVKLSDNPQPHRINALSAAFGKELDLKNHPPYSIFQRVSPLKEALQDRRERHMRGYGLRPHPHICWFLSAEWSFFR